jgi:signal transduction histidine kinase
MISKPRNTNLIPLVFTVLFCLPFYSSCYEFGEQQAFDCQKIISNAKQISEIERDTFTKEEELAFLEAFNCPEILTDAQKWAKWFDILLEKTQTSENRDSLRNQTFGQIINDYCENRVPPEMKADAQFKLGRYYFSKKYYTHAVIHMNTALDFAEEAKLPDLAVKILLELIPACLEGFDFQKAGDFLEVLNTYLKENSTIDHPALYSILSDIWQSSIYLETDKPDSAQLVLKTVTESLNEIPVLQREETEIYLPIYQNLTLNYLKLDNISLAENYRQKYIELDDGSAKSRIVDAYFFIKKGNLEETERILTAHPNLFEGVYNWIKLEYYLAKGAYEIANEITEEEISLIINMIQESHKKYMDYAIEEFDYIEKQSKIDALKRDATVIKRRGILLTIISFFLVGFGAGLAIISKKIRSKNKKLQELNNFSNNQNQELSMLNKKMEDFVHSLSHDANSYLDMILNYSSPDLNDYQKETNKAKINKYARHLKEMSLNLINYHFLEKGYYKGTVQLNDLIEEIKDEFPNYFENTILETNLAEKSVLADPIKLKKVFLNLVQNSHKFKQENEQHYISISSRTDPTDQGRVLISFVDNGIGIPEKNLPVVFNKFFSTGSELESSGLGLFISREIIEKMNGIITVASVEGQGATFYITLLKPS